MSNHPIHIVNEDSGLSPSAFIPFCAFGNDMSSMGVKIEQFNVPVCKSFKAKNLNNQLCYEVDVKKIYDKSKISNDLKIGLLLILDYNEDRQLNSQQVLQSQENHFLQKFGK